MERKSEFNFLSISFMFRWESILQKCSESDAKRCGVDCLRETKVGLIFIWEEIDVGGGRSC
jgi:hypothetical protein